MIVAMQRRMAVLAIFWGLITEKREERVEVGVWGRWDEGVLMEGKDLL